MKKTTGTGTVYQIVNIFDGKKYVGSTINRQRRRNDHITNLKRGVHDCVYLQNAYNKHGRHAFTIFEIVEEFDLPEIEDTKFNKRTIWRPLVLAREQVYLDLLRDDDYNTCRIAGSRLGTLMPEGFGEQVSKRMKLYMSQPEIVEKYRQLRLGKSWEALFGIEQSDQMKQNVSQKRTGQRLGVSPPNKGVPMSDAQKTLLHVARVAYIAEYGVWNAGLTWDAIFGLDNANERKMEYARLAEKWFGMVENRDRHREAVNKGTQVRIERDGKHWFTGTTRSVEQRRKDALSHDGTLHEFQGELRSVPEIARLVGSTRELIRDRLARDETIEHAVRSERSKGGSKVGHETSDETARKISEAQKGKPRDWQKGKSSKPSKSGEFGIQVRPDGRFAVRLQNKVYGKHLTLEEAIAHRDELLRLQKGA